MEDPNLIPETVFDDLQTRGYAVVEGFLEEPLRQALYDEAMARYDEGRMRAAAVGTADEKRRIEEVRGDYIQWLEGDTEAQRDFLARIEAYRLALNRRFFLGINGYEAHFAYYPEGRRYQKHWDNFKGRNQRIVTTVCYLNPEWRSEWGGELLVYDAHGERVVEKVLPTPGTLVTFMTEEVPHEVAPTKRARLSIAGWLRRD
ncbi:2OG-Fe(II) oxygenase [Hydrogenimonas sp.]